jgi:folate-dependent phosphoribosylglycinamide formyltransferase PurN
MTSKALTGRIPTAILMSGSGSNARKLLEYMPPADTEPNYEVRLIVSDNPGSNYRRIAEEHGVKGLLNDIYEFCGVPHPDRGLNPEDRKKLREPARREQFDRSTDRILDRYGVQLVALAGYDWIIAPFLCQKYIVLNVHPGDLRVRDSSGRRRYIGLGWIPTAKAILAGERLVHSTTHLVTAELDGGPIARVSQAVSIDLPAGTRPDNILPDGIELGDVICSLGRGDDPAIASNLLVTHSRRVQERLKEFGDWIEFPRTADEVAALMRSGRLVRAASGKILLDEQPVEDLFLLKYFSGQGRLEK